VARDGGGGFRVRVPLPPPLSPNSAVDLGVHMIVDDSGTMDIHGDEMGGWPPVVRPILDVAHGADYDVSALPAGLRERTLGKVRSLFSAKEEEYNLERGLSSDGGPRQKSSTRDRRLRGPPISRLAVKRPARGVTWGAAVLRRPSRRLPRRLCAAPTASLNRLQ